MKAILSPLEKQTLAKIWSRYGFGNNNGKLQIHYVDKKALRVEPIIGVLNIE